MRENNMLFLGDSVNTSRIIYTPSDFAKLSLLHIQEIGYLQATSPHVSKRGNLASYLFFLVQSGSGSLNYDGASYPLTQGDCVFIDCRKPYSHETSRQLWKLSWIHFDGPTAGNIYQKYKERGGQPTFRPASSEDYLRVFRRLYEEAGGASYVRDMEINTGLSELLCLLMTDSWHPEQIKTGTKKIEMLQIQQYLQEHYAEKITLEDLSQRFYINKFYLTRVFKEQFGITIGDYLLNLRITKAKHLLRFTKKTAEEIGRECGIGDMYYFSRIFKKVEMISIREFRKQWGA